MDRHVLVIEDDRDIGKLVTLHLEDLGCEVDWTPDGESGLRRLAKRAYDLVVLDLMLPGIDGLDVCRNLRERPHYTPILMLTAKSSEVDRVVGLELGADDYLTKPFSIRELLARVKAIFRRVDAITSEMGGGDVLEPTIEARELRIDTVKRRVTLADRPIALTAKEFDLLVQFARNPGRVYTRAQLLDLVWGYGHDSYQHTVNSHINRLRAKIERDPGEPELIQTVWGVGYKFSDPEEWGGS